MLYLDYLSYNNNFKTVSVTEKLLFCGAGLITALCFDQPLTLVAIILLTQLMMLAAGIPSGYIVRLWLAPAAFLAIGIVTVAVNINLGPFPALHLVQWGPLYLGVTAESLRTAQTLALRSGASVSCLFLLAATTPVMHIVALAGRLGPLRTIMEITLLTYRFIFVILAAAGRIYTAQQSRLGYASKRNALSSLSALVSNLGRTAFLTARDLNIALLSRNYTDKLVLRCPQQAVRPLRLLAILTVWPLTIILTAYLGR